MKYIEVSKKIKLSKKATQNELKEAVLVRLNRAFDIDDLKEKGSTFTVRGTTGGPGVMPRHARVNLDVTVAKSGESVRVLVHGRSKMALSLSITYSVLFFVILLTGLLPGSIETNGENSGAMDALVLMIFGIFIFYDINKKVTEPKDYLQSALDSLETEFG